jgi:hypothetical protein
VLIKLRTYLEPLMKGVSPDDDLEGFVHEVSHLVTLTSVPKTKHLLMSSDGIDVKGLIETKLKTAKAQDTNEVKTTAVTILAMERLGGGTFAESMANMFMNLQTLARPAAYQSPTTETTKLLKLAKEPFLMRAVYMILEPRVQALATSMVKMLKELDDGLLDEEAT